MYQIDHCSCCNSNNLCVLAKLKLTVANSDVTINQIEDLNE